MEAAIPAAVLTNRIVAIDLTEGSETSFCSLPGNASPWITISPAAKDGIVVVGYSAGGSILRLGICTTAASTCVEACRRFCLCAC
jgi:hypothetical protein